MAYYKLILRHRTFPHQNFNAKQFITFEPYSYLSAYNKFDFYKYVKVKIFSIQINRVLIGF